MENREKYRSFSAFIRNSKPRDSLFFKILLGMVVTLFFTLLFPTTEAIDEPRHIGTVWTDADLYAPFSFPINKDDVLYEQEKNAARTSVNPVVERLPSIEKVQIDTLSEKTASLKAVTDAFRKWKSSRDTADSAAFSTMAQRFDFLATGWDSVSRIGSGQLAAIQNELRTQVADIYRAGILDSGLLKRQHKFLSLRRGRLEEPLPASKVRSLPEAQIELRTRLMDHFGEGTVSQVAFALGAAVLVPNIRFNATETAHEVKSAMENVPRTLGYVQEGERIVGKNERITEEIKLRLDSYSRAKVDRGTEVDARGQRFGVGLHVLLILALYVTYLFLFRKKIIHDATLLAVIALILCIVGLVAYLTRIIDLAFPARYLIPVPVAAMLLTIIFDSRVAFYGTVTLALLVGGIHGNDYMLTLSSIIAGALGAYTVRDIKSRTQIFRSLGFIFLGYAFSIVALGLERFENFEAITLELVLAFTNALISSVFTYAMLIFLERFFNVTTDLRLLELADFNHPLLQRLSEEAPGTFHHSVTLGNLAEAAADDIGANSILARVGAYYHDVGKLIKPEYFVENQVGQPNRHTKLKPRMSAKIIIAHVTEGMELARQYRVPEKVVDFIPQHHGTTRISFFFDKALKQAAARKNNKEVIREEDFRYPGPKPQSREAAIVMLADTVEATTRSVVEMTPQKLEATIDGMIKQRFVEGELDDCELTMRDLTKIREAFLQILIGIHHHRIQYPQQREEEALHSTVPVIPQPRRAPRPAAMPPAAAGGEETIPPPQMSADAAEPMPEPTVEATFDVPVAELPGPPEGERETDAENGSGGTGASATDQPGTEYRISPEQHWVQTEAEKPDHPAYDTFGEAAPLRDPEDDETDTPRNDAAPPENTGRQDDPPAAADDEAQRKPSGHAGSGAPPGEYLP